MIVEAFQYLFEADTAKLVEGEKTAQQQNDKLQQGLKKTDQLANNMGTSFTDLIATAGGALTALLSFSALSSGIMETSAYIDNLAKVSDRLGENINDMGAWQEVVKKSGGDIGSFQGTLKGFTSQLQDLAVKGQNEMLPFLQKLGINFKDSNGKVKSALTLFPELADSFSKLSKTESAGIGQKLGLDEGTISLLQQGRKEVEKQIQGQKKLFTITKEQAKTFETFNDSIDDTKTAFRGLFTQLGSDIVPIFQYFLEKVQSGVSFFATHKDLMTGIFIGLGVAISAYALPAMIRFGIATITAFAPFYLIGAIIAGITLAVALLYDETTTFLSGGNSAFEDMLRWLGMTQSEIDNLRQMFLDAGTAIADIFYFLGQVFMAFLNIGATVAQGLYQVFEPLLWLFGKGIIGAIELAISGIKKIAEVAKGVMDFFGLGDSSIKVEDSLPGAESENKLSDSIASNKNSGLNMQNISDAMGSANSNPLNYTNSNLMNKSSSNVSNSVTVDKVEINTQATDADGIASAFNDSLSAQLKRTTATFEDGIEG